MCMIEQFPAAMSQMPIPVDTDTLVIRDNADIYERAHNEQR